MLKKIILFTIIIFQFYIIQAQQPQIQFNHLKVEDGLSQSWIKSIYQDKQGFMWFGTNDGLNKYDGYSFTIYKHNLKNKYSNFQITSDPSNIKKADFVIIAVPTPVNRSKEPDLSFTIKASRIVGQNIKKDSIIILESTVYPGVTEDIIKPILEQESGFACGIDFKIGYSPERVNPGDKKHTIDKITKIKIKESINQIAKNAKLLMDLLDQKDK